MFSIIGVILQFILALFRRAERKDTEATGAAKAELETRKRNDELLKQAAEAKQDVDLSIERILNDPNNKLRR